jgi:hypothetical protein
VLFLRATPPALPVVIGLSMGVFRVVSDPNGVRLVTPPPIGAGGSVGAVTRGNPARRPLSLPEFAEAVRLAQQAPVGLGAPRRHQ